MVGETELFRGLVSRLSEHYRDYLVIARCPKTQRIMYQTSDSLWGYGAALKYQELCDNPPEDEDD